MAPSLAADDSSETITAQNVLGIQHPPGYPLNTLAGKVFSYLPLGSAAFRANCMSLLLHVLTAFMLYVLIRAHSGISGGMRYFTAVTAAVVYFFAFTPLSQASSVKGSIYTLNALLSVLIIYNVFKAERDRRFLYISGFLYGLAAANHWPSAAVLLPAVIFYLAVKTKYRPAEYLKALAFFGLASTVWLAVIIRSNAPAVYTWGEIGGIADLINMFLMKHFGAFSNTMNQGMLPEMVKYYLSTLLQREYPFFLAVLVLPGAWHIIRKNGMKGLFIVLSYVLLTLSVILSSSRLISRDTQWVMMPLLTSSLIFVSVLLAYGAAFPVSLLMSVKPKYGKALAVFTCMAISALMVFTARDRSGDYYTYDYLNNISKSVPDGALFFAEGEVNAFGGLYLKHVTGKKIYPVTTQLLAFDWYRQGIRNLYSPEAVFPSENVSGRDYLKEFMLLNSSKGVYYSEQYTAAWQPLPMKLRGIVFEIDTGMGADKEPVETVLLYSFRGGYKKTGADDFEERMILRRYGTCFERYGELHAAAGNNSRAEYYFSRALYIEPTSKRYLRLGEAVYNLGQTEEAERAFLASALMNRSDYRPYLFLSKLYAEAGDVTKAIEYMNRVKALNPAGTAR